MTHILHTGTVDKTASLADEGISAAHTTLNIYRPKEISIKGSPQHCCPSEGSNSALYARENDAFTARLQLHIVMREPR